MVRLTVLSALLFSACSADLQTNPAADPTADAAFDRVHRPAGAARWLGGGFYGSDAAAVIVDTPAGERALSIDAMAPNTVHLMAWGASGPRSDRQFHGDDYAVFVTAADFNGDGLRDGLWTTMDGRTFLLDATSAQPTQLPITLPTDEAPQVGDFDGSGAQTLALQTAAGVQIWGPLGLMRTVSAPNAYGYILAVGQLDADPQVELIAHGGAGDDIIDGLTGAVTHTVRPAGRDTLTGLADVNGDGVQELFWTSSTSPTTTPGGAWTPAAAQLWSSAAMCGAPRVLDADADGDADVACLVDTGAAANIIATDALTGAEVRRAGVFSAGPDFAYEVADLDGDGADELYLANNRRTIWGGAASATLTARTPLNARMAPVLTDVDQDGALDAVWGREDATAGRNELRLVATNLNAHTEIVSPPIAGLQGWKQISAQADGTPQIVAWGVVGTQLQWDIWYVSDGAWNRTRARVVPNVAPQVAIPVEVGAGPTILWYLGQQDALGHQSVSYVSSSGSPRWELARSGYDLQLGDVNGDGQTDLLVDGTDVLDAATGALISSLPVTLSTPTIVPGAVPYVVGDSPAGLVAASWDGAGWVTSALPAPGGVTDLFVTGISAVNGEALIAARDLAAPTEFNARLWRVNLTTGQIDWAARNGPDWALAGAATAHQMVHLTGTGIAMFQR